MGQADDADARHDTPVDADVTPDDLLVERARAGNARAFDDLYTRYEREIRGFVTARLSGDATTAEDVTSKVFTKVFRFLDKYKAGSFRGWLYEITRNTVLDHLRGRRPTLTLDEANVTAIPTPTMGLEELLSSRRRERRSPPPWRRSRQCRAASSSFASRDSDQPTSPLSSAWSSRP